MAIAVYVVKRYLRGKRKNGQRKYRYALRWRDPTSGEWACESTQTSDRTEADSLQKLKWAEVNGLIQPDESTAEIEPEPIVKPTWRDCKDALERAMTADNLRRSSIDDALLMLEILRRMFLEAESPVDLTPAMANEFKRRRAEQGLSPWTIKGDLSSLKAIFGKWLGRECGLLTENPFANVKPPKCDDPDVRIVTAEETRDLFAWFNKRWNNWRLPLVYLEVASLLGWRATETASIREDDILADGFVRVAAATSKTRKWKYGWLPADLHAELKSCCAGGFAFGRFTDELRRLLFLWRKAPHHAAKVKDYTPERLVFWLQDELKRYHDGLQDAETKAAEQEGRKPVKLSTFTLHDFRRTAITGMQMAGVSEKEASIMVGATPEVIRKHYEKLDGMAIARRNVERRLVLEKQTAQSLRARCARAENEAVDNAEKLSQAAI